MKSSPAGVEPGAVLWSGYQNKKCAGPGDKLLEDIGCLDTPQSTSAG